MIVIPVIVMPVLVRVVSDLVRVDGMAALAVGRMVVVVDSRSVQHQRRIDPAPFHRQHTGSRSGPGPDPPDHIGGSLGRQPVGPADQHQISRLQLIVEQLLEGGEVIEAGVGPPLGFHRFGISDDMASRQRFAIDHRHHRLHAHARPDRRPAEGRHQGGRKGQAAGFHDDAVELIRAFQQALHRRQEVVLHGAAEAAVGELHQAAVPFLFGAEAAGGDQIAVDAHIPEFVDDDGQALAALQQQVAQQGGFASPQEARHDGDGKTGW